MCPLHPVEPTGCLAVVFAVAGAALSAPKGVCRARPNCLSLLSPCSNLPHAFHAPRWWRVAGASQANGGTECRSGLTPQKRCCRRGWNRCGRACWRVLVLGPAHLVVLQLQPAASLGLHQPPLYLRLVPNPTQFPESAYLHILYSSFLIEARKQYQVRWCGCVAGCFVLGAWRSRREHRQAQRLYPASASPLWPPLHLIHATTTPPHLPQRANGMLEQSRKLEPGIGERFMLFVRDRWVGGDGLNVRPLGAGSACQPPGPSTLFYVS